MLSRNYRVIRTDLIRDNMRKIRNATDRRSKVLAVVKADGYGHGAPETARAALGGGADMLAVACVAEGVALRDNGITAPILVLGAVMEGDVYEGVQYGLIQTVCTPEMVYLCDRAGKELRRKAEIHLKIDSGMGRIGIRNEKEMENVLLAVGNSDSVLLTGAFTHFSDADDGQEGMAYTDMQFERFVALTKMLPEGLLLHCSNSAAIHRRPDYSLGMVRAGISLYGYPPVPENVPDLLPCMEWISHISFIKDVPAGSYISYGRTFRTEKNTRIATVTCGYGDGYHRNASGKAEVLIRGRRARIIGRICMDQMLADISEIPEAKVNDPVTLIGKNGDEQITAEDIAAWSGTISYEVLLSAGSRVERIFLDHPDKEEGKET